MARSINFVRERRRNLSRQEESDRQVLKFATFGMFGLGVIILLIVGARLYLLYQISSTQTQEKSVQAAISQKEGIEEQYTIFANKLKILTELFGKRKEKQEALAYFSSLFGPNVIISQLSYKGGDEVLSFVLQTTDIFSMEEVFNIISSKEVSARYPTIKKETLRRGPDGSYGMQVTLYFGDKPAEVPGAADASGSGETTPEATPAGTGTGT